MIAPVLPMVANEVAAELRKALRSPAYVVPSFAFPLVFYTLVAIVLAREASARAAALATIGVFASLGPTLFGIASEVAAERESGLAALQRVAPLPAWLSPLAKVATAGAIAGAALGLTYLLAGASGVTLLPIRWASLAAVHALAVVPFGLLGLVLGTLVRGQGAVALANVLLLLFGILGGLWIPLRMLPGWARAIAPLTPAFHLGELALSAIGRSPTLPAAVHLTAIGVWIVIPALVLRFAIRRDIP